MTLRPDTYRDFRITYTYGGAFEAHYYAETLDKAKRLADRTAEHPNVEYVGVYDRNGTEVYQIA